MSTFVWTIVLMGIIEILFGVYRLGTGTWRPSTREDAAIGLCVWVCFVLWGGYVLARL